MFKSVGGAIHFMDNSEGVSTAPLADIAPEHMEESRTDGQNHALAAPTAPSSSDAAGMFVGNSSSQTTVTNGFASGTLEGKIVPNPRDDNSFSRVILTDWLVNPGGGENPKSEIVE